MIFEEQHSVYWFAPLGGLLIGLVFLICEFFFFAERVEISSAGYRRATEGMLHWAGAWFLGSLMMAMQVASDGGPGHPMNSITIAALAYALIGGTINSVVKTYNEWPELKAE